MIDLRRILVPTDFSKYSDVALTYATALAEKFNSELYLLHVVQDLAVFVPDAVAVTPPVAVPVEQFAAAARAALARAVSQYHLDRFTVHAEVREGPPFSEIIRYAKEAAIDLIVMGTHGHTG